MKLKRMITFGLLVCILTALCGCNTIDNIAGGSFDDTYTLASEPEPKPEFATNPLTGLENLDWAKESARPVAVMVNNLASAQGVQTGLGEADLVYETFVEGGITRLMAVYKDISKAGQIGTVRSARYSYVELAAALDAIYVHAGMDPNYCKPFMRSLNFDDFDIDAGAHKYGFRSPNGLAHEHTLYTKGELLTQGFSALDWRTAMDGAQAPIMQFRKADASAPAGEGVANSVSIQMSKAYQSGFQYNAETKTYSKIQNGKPHKDYLTGEQLSFKNVFVLGCKITTMPDGKHVKTELTSGAGYYLSEGGYTEISWSKGDTCAPLTFKKADGSTLSVNAGTSFICLANKDYPNWVTIQ